VSEVPVNPNEPEPPKREFRFKPTEFERANPKIGAENNAPPINVQDLFRQANATKAPTRGKPAAAAVNEVHAILRGNLDRANQDGANDVSLRPKRASGRKRDFWFLLIAGNLFLGGISLLSRNFIVLVCGGAGMIAFTLGATWVMWHVMDDY
jgi:hypothetical protein